MKEARTPPRKAAAKKTPTSRGRPKDPEKRAAILEAAKRMFTDGGLEGTSMEALAHAAGVSKLTLYSHFKSKEELFQQAVMAKCREHTPEEYFDIRARLPLRERLRLIAGGFIDLIMSPEAMGLYRMMTAQAGGTPLARLFWEAGPERSMRDFSTLLEAARAAGELEFKDARRTASHFFCLIKGESHLKMMVGAATEPTKAEKRRHIEDVLDLFLKAYGKR